MGEVTNYSITEEQDFFKHLELTQKEQQIATMILKEISDRLDFLDNVGLDYLTLSRSSGTLSGGEAQRIRLATQIGSALTGVLYVLDEPSIGLHQRDNDRLITTLKQMRDLDNTVIVVEHDEDTMLAADWLIDIGPGAGDNQANKNQPLGRVKPAFMKRWRVLSGPEIMARKGRHPGPVGAPENSHILQQTGCFARKNKAQNNRCGCVACTQPLVHVVDQLMTAQQFNRAIAKPVAQGQTAKQQNEHGQRVGAVQPARQQPVPLQPGGCRHRTVTQP